MEVVGSVSSIIGLCCFLHEVIKENYQHFRTPKRSIQQLNNLMQELDARKNDVQHELNQLCHGNRAEPTYECRYFFKQVDDIKLEVSSLMDKTGPHRPTKGCCFIRSRIKLGKLIEEKIEDLLGLLRSLPYVYDHLVAIPVRRGDVFSTIQMMECETRKQIFMKIWGFLLDENARRIGVWGMGGVGKTTIMSEINNRLVEGSSHFNCIIWVEASKDLKKLQQDIAVKLGLTFQEIDDGRGRALKLFEAFHRRKTFALILDDVWEPFSIEEVGIPEPTVDNGCKLVIITRSLMVCRVMEADKDVEVKVLAEDEAWNLFKEKVGELVLSDHNVQSIAMDVAKECGGLPLAIVAVGRALRNSTNVREWENAVEELRSSSTGIYNIDEAVCSRLKFSYSKLKDDTRRSCFLYCALYPKGQLIDENELINYWMWDDLLGGATTSTIEMKRRKGQMILIELEYNSLLESKIENGVRCVKLHDLVRDMAIAIMSTKPRCIVNAGIEQVKRPPPQEWKEDVKWVSLMRNDVKSIEFSPMCPALTSLLLQYNSFEKNISSHLFDNMQGLKVLNLSYTGISALPGSLSNLENLCALICSHCWDLVEVPSLARLTKLDYLDFSFSRYLEELPEGMEQLSCLRHLDFSFTSVQNLKDGVISKFTRLEELLILGSHMTGVSSKDTKPCSYPVRIEEIVSCFRLSLVHMQLFDIGAYFEIVRSPKFSWLTEFKLVIGFQGDIPELFEKTSLAIDMYDADNLSDAEIYALIPKNVMELTIHNSSSLIKRLSLYLPKATCLKTCNLRSCLKIECILESEENDLSQLERMNLYDFPELRMICGKVLKPGTLANLKSIHVEDCGSLKFLFPRQLMFELKSLEEITIIHCVAMEEVIEGEKNTKAEISNHAANVVLPKLQRLNLINIQYMECIYNGDIQCDSLRTIEVFGCDYLNKLPLGLIGIEAGEQMSPSNSLEQITGEQYWWESLQWDQPQAKHLLQPYFVDSHSRDRFAPGSSNTT